MKLSISFIISIGILVFFSACRQQEKILVLNSPAGVSSRLPYLTVDEQGTAFLSWTENIDSTTIALKYARFSDEKWTEPQVIAKGDDWFVNWADFPSIVVSKGSPLAAHWLHKLRGGTYAYEINLSMTKPSDPWHTTLVPHNDGTATEHGFVSMISWDGNNILAVWLDGRQTARRAENEYSDLSKAMTIRSAIITNEGSVSGRQLIDESVCDCCQTSLAKTRTGAVVAYRNRTEEEIRDIYVSRYRVGSWSEPVSVHHDGWQIGGCPVNGPKIAAHGDTVLVAWPTGANDSFHVQAAFSFDGGISFNEPVIIDDGNPIGRVDAVFIEGKYALVSWMEKPGENAELKVRRLEMNQKNELNPSLTVTKMDPHPDSGFPQLEISNNRALFAWTYTNGQTQVRLASLPLRLLFNE